MMTMLQADLDNVIRIIESVVSEDILDNKLKLFVSGSSKRIRSILAILYCKAQCFDMNDDVYKLLAVGELVHNASLLHDDIIDNSDIRRDDYTFNKIYGAKISILAGDYLLGVVTDLLVQLGNNEIITLFSNCLKNMCEAEINQYFWRGKMPTEGDYIEICKGKTGQLFSTILESVAILLNSDRESAKNFGMIYGLMFQIENDLDEASAKKDKNNGIYTAKDIMGIEKTNCLLDNYKGKLLNLIGNIPQNEYKIRLEDLVKGL